MEPCEELGDKVVGIVGAGPAGLSTAYFLRLMGIGSVLYERMAQAGGMLRYGIPEFRLPKEMLDREIAHFAKMGGIDIKYGEELGKTISMKELQSRHDAVAVTIGCWSSAAMRTEGEELATGGIAWLEEIALNGWKGANPGKTIVIGGGDVAMDCLRTAIRLGGEATCLYRRTEKEMPAERLEVEEAREEGVQFEFLAAPVEVRVENGKFALTCQRMELAISDWFAGRPHSEPPAFNVSRGHWSSLRKDDLVFLKDPADSERLQLPYISMDERRTTFREVTKTASLEQVTVEGERCYECSCTDKKDCLLKRHSESYEAKPDAIGGEKEVVSYDTRHPTIILDRGKCIKCGTCIKVCAEIVNQNLLGLKQRGFAAQVGTPMDAPLPETCSECGACIPECPVGALAWKRKRDD